MEAAPTPVHSSIKPKWGFSCAQCGFAQRHQEEQRENPLPRRGTSLSRAQHPQAPLGRLGNVYINHGPNLRLNVTAFSVIMSLCNYLDTRYYLELAKSS